eukprot:jgi/Undpi1/12646/HiC_scaffold_6.g02314.m1
MILVLSMLSGDEVLPELRKSHAAPPANEAEDRIPVPEVVAAAVLGSPTAAGVREGGGGQAGGETGFRDGTASAATTTVAIGAIAAGGGGQRAGETAPCDAAATVAGTIGAIVAGGGGVGGAEPTPRDEGDEPIDVEHDIPRRESDAVDALTPTVEGQ